VEPGSDFKGTRRFRVLRCIGAGGMGEVYEAFDRANHARVALKLLTVRRPEALLRFKNEFRALRDLEHPNLVSFGDLLEEDGRWFFTMEFVDGVDFLSYVRPGDRDDVAMMPTAQIKLRRDRLAMTSGELGRALPGFDEARLRHALRQLVDAVAALHAAGKIHRDLKPSNIRVTRDGRLVVLDFGLVSDLERPAHITADEELIGTPAFVAPEQAGMREVGPPADWYSVGVILYQSLTRHLPFDGTAMEIVVHKQHLDPPAPRDLVPEVPADLDALCSDLLRRNPQARPDDREILRRVGADQDEPPRIAAATVSSQGYVPPLIGRAGELDTLAGLLDVTRTGRAATVYLQGESGVGKSALVRRFAELAVTQLGAVVLSGCCYENELVPFKAIDGVVDELVRYMKDLPRDAAAALLPAKAALLPLAFPVFRSVESVMEAPMPLEAVRDPHELRSRTFLAIRELLARLAERHPVIVALDDMQWTDADSVALLREIMRGPDAPALLLLIVVRSDGTPHEVAAMPGEVHHLSLARLPSEQARELAGHVLAQLSGVHDDAVARTIADEADGHPLFIDELARHVHAAGDHPGPLHLEQALWHRIDALGAETLAILQVVAIAGAPVPKTTAARALGIDFGELTRRAALLRLTHLLRLADKGRGDSLEPYHDRVRAAVLARLDDDTRRALHRRLAIAHEASRSGDLEALTSHWQGAGEPERAVRYALQAAAQAAATLAFDRAARMYGLALGLGIADPGEAQQARIAYGDALRNSGFGGDAARAYLDAAAAATQAADRLDLQRRAAEELLLSGHFDDGLIALDGVLRTMGMSLPSTPRRALASLLFNRARLRLRGLHFREQDVSQLSAEELTRCDVSWSAAAGLSIIDNIRGADFQCRNLLRALHNGEPHRIVRALAVEAGHLSIGGVRADRRSGRLLAACEELAIRLRDPYALGLQRIAAGMAALLSGRWRRGNELCNEGEVTLRDHCTGIAWEVDTAQSFAMDCLWFLGELRELEGRLPIRIAEAHERGDLYASINFRTGAPNLVWLVAGDVEQARGQCNDAMARWSRRGVHVQHYRELFSQAHIDLYVGDGEAALRRIEAAWRSLDRALLFRITLIRMIMTELRARAALATAVRSPRDRGPLLRAVRRDIRVLAGEPMAWCAAAVDMLRAGIAAVAGDPDAAIAALRRAAPGFDHAEMATHAAAARRRLGALVGGDEGAALIADADAWLTGQGVRSPDAVTAMLAPGFDT